MVSADTGVTWKLDDPYVDSLRIDLKSEIECILCIVGKYHK